MKRQLWLEKALADDCPDYGIEDKLRELYDEAYKEGYEDGVNA